MRQEREHLHLSLVHIYVFGIERALYAIITIVVVNRIADAMIEGVKFAKAAYIITDRYDEVAETVMHGVDRGLDVYKRQAFST